MKIVIIIPPIKSLQGLKMRYHQCMPNIRPVSDLRNYNDVLKDISEGEPVYLTKNGRGRYAVLDIDEYERLLATVKLLNELAKGEKSGREHGWVSKEEAKKRLGLEDE